MTRLLLVVAVLLPVGLWAGLARTDRRGPALDVERLGSTFPDSKLPLEATVESPEEGRPPRITNIQITDLDQDGEADVVVCDALRDRVLWRRRAADGRWTETALADENDLPAPGHAHVVDMDQDGDLDILVALLGSIGPTDDRVGALALLEQIDPGQFKAQVVLDDVRRVTDAQPGDFDGDGDLDLAVAVFGFSMGRVLWLENDRRSFRQHELLVGPGAIHVPVADFDGDGDLDIATVMSQNEESVVAFENLGGGEFRQPPRRLWSTTNFDFGSSGLVATDLDQDQDLDLLLLAGDSLEVLHHHPRPSHSCVWLENRGDWTFSSRQLAQFGGVYGGAVGDLDGDQDLDVVLVSMFNDWRTPGAASVVWLENDGQQQFTPWQIAEQPIHLSTVACGDLNGDGRDDVVAGVLHLFGPSSGLARLGHWLSKPPE